ncbi:MAG: hypothetical protein FJW35_17805, partial [Acidobacteria bacterium]|nr:hypothetical protein [Acidobacteriota bacterium]
MFEFAINQNKRHKPSARAVYSFISSCALHLALLLVLIENPHFLDTGISRWFRAQLRAYPTETREWRPVALLSTPERMTMPSPEVLKQAMYDWEAAKGKGLQPPVRVSWSAEQLAALADAPPVRPVPGLEEPQPAPPATAGTEPQPGTETGKEGGT